ncbi:MAG: putative metal-dependent hydrolase [Winogradskyella sp.]|uniref:YfiT family bacillithiol transferase n=1 Tax=Winogradskyella sp. TaxID=1883156 RepID=UPI000F3E6F4B|nr:putative metal-dependent hydrolase [Winogradskyella sp.]RNC83550.1 MAG: putative metal-dependent hydrolase [Winogradskyella sp.]
MNAEELEQLKYPIGEFTKPDHISKKQLDDWIFDIENFPKAVESITNNLSESELNYKYRPDGWTIRQVVHHCADSHINSITRFKLALTEDTPTIRPYFEDRWAKLNDYSEPLEAPIHILKGVHQKLGILLRGLNDEELKKEFVHPEHGKHFSLEETIGTYAWHSNHHLAHIKQALKHKGEF